MSVIQHQLLPRLRQRIHTDYLLTQAEELAPYECDGLSMFQQRPGIVVLPATVEEVQFILQSCYQLDIPVIARGAGTGLSGGATPRQDAVLLSLSRFNQILEVDVENLTARMQPGVRNLAISEAVATKNLFYAPDPSSQIICSIGGNVAENSGGVHCLKYGLTVHNVIAVTIVTMEGEILQFGGASLDTPGYDLLALMHGSEGMLGVIVEISVRLLPKPEHIQVLLAAFADVSKASDAVTSIIAQGIIPAGLEMMDNLAIRAAEDFVHAGYPVDAAAILLCELDGSNTEVAEDVMRVQKILMQHNATAIRSAKTRMERDVLWAGRKAAFPAAGRISPDYYCMDGTIPRKYLATVLQRIANLSRQYGLRVANVFHAGDGNLHPLILFDANKQDELQRTQEFGAEILRICIECGGTITGEHGVGIEKIDQMCEQFTPNELTQFHAIKAAFDEKSLLNPGKAVPTLHHCAEFGAMHVHHGKLPHPDLPRF